MRKVICIGLALLICFAGVVCFRIYVRERASVRELLHKVDVSANTGVEKVAHDIWKDPLSYVSGFEVTVFEFDSDGWTVPESWYQNEIAIADLEAIFDFDVRETAFSGLDVDVPDVFDAYYFVEHGIGGRCLDFISPYLLISAYKA